MREAVAEKKQAEIAAGSTGEFRATPHASNSVALAALMICAFALYWTSSFSLEQRGAMTYFGADSWHFTELAHGRFNDRIMRLHPVTVVLALGWMKILAPLTAWIAPVAILKAMFALIGALGTWAAVHAFSVFMPRRQALLWGIIYAASTGIWYFSSIEESKIVSATLATLYIALYLHLRANWTRRGAFLLTGVLFFACLNEITAAFLVVIPALDTLLKTGPDRRGLPWRGRQWRELQWVLLHALAATGALVVLELIRHHAVTVVYTGEGTNFIEIFLHYFSRNVYTLQTVIDFLKRWFFFNIAAPEAEINYAIPKLLYGGDFEPLLQHYFAAPASAAFVAAFAAMIAAAWWYREPTPRGAPLAGLMLALCAYALTRMMFFLLFLPSECLLYSPSVTLVHLIPIAAPFAASRFPYKGLLAATAAAALLISNGLFIFTARTIALPAP